MKDPNIINYTEIDTSGLQKNYATQNKWIGYIPLSLVMGNKFKNLELELVRFTIPSTEIGTTTVQFRGSTYEYPTKLITPDTKNITFEYIVDEQWNNYKALHSWATGLGIITPTTEEGWHAMTLHQSVPEAENLMSTMIECRVWLLNAYKKRVIDFRFDNCFIKSFSELALDYSQTGEVHHSFTLAYTDFRIVEAS